MSKSRADWANLIIAAAATIALMVSLAAYCENSRSNKLLLETSQKHNRLSVTPILYVYAVTVPEGEEERGIYIRNVGLGPAKVTLLSCFIHGQDRGWPSDRDDWKSVGEELALKGTLQFTTFNEAGFTIAEGAEMRLIGLQHTASDPTWHMRSVLEAMNICVTYESIYGQEFGPECLTDE